MQDYDPTHATKARVKAIPPESADVVVVGAGLGGLMAAARLAQQGQKVAVFDQHYVAGGCCTMFSRGGPRSRRNFDIGLHYIGDCGPGGQIPELLADVGIELDYTPLDSDGFDTLVFPDLEFRIPVGWEPYRQRLLEHFPKEHKGIDRYLRFLREVDHMMSAMQKHKPGMRLAWEAATNGRMASQFLRATLKEVLDTCFTDPLLRAVVAGQSGDYGLPPSRVSAALHAGLVNHYFKGAYYPTGGGQIIADRLAETIEANGGSVHLRRGIEQILVENGQVTGVRTEAYKGAQYTVHAPQVISNADLQLTLDHLLPPGALGGPWLEQRRNFEMAAALYICCLNVRGDMRERGMRSANYWQFDGTDMEDFYAATDLKPRGCYITAATLKDPSSRHHAPEGEDSVEVMTILPGDAALWGVEKDSLQDWRYKK
ncbi:MAG: phytoene desaturase family protein, partial [Oceanococcaceae bacterium]